MRRFQRSDRRRRRPRRCLVMGRSTAMILRRAGVGAVRHSASQRLPRLPAIVDPCRGEHGEGRRRSARAPDGVAEAQRGWSRRPPRSAIRASYSGRLPRRLSMSSNAVSKWSSMTTCCGRLRRRDVDAGRALRRRTTASPDDRRWGSISFVPPWWRAEACEACHRDAFGLFMSSRPSRLLFGSPSRAHRTARLDCASAKNRQSSAALAKLARSAYRPDLNGMTSTRVRGKQCQFWSLGRLATSAATWRSPSRTPAKKQGPIVDNLSTGFAWAVPATATLCRRSRCRGLGADSAAI